MKVSQKKITSLAAQLGVDPDFLKSCLEHEIMLEENLSEAESLPPEAAVRMRRLQRICRTLDIDAFAAALILDMREQLEAAQREIELLRLWHKP